MDDPAFPRSHHEQTHANPPQGMKPIEHSRADELLFKIGNGYSLGRPPART
jgi:hypothetical protein